jgi:hypothetical protein
MTAEERPEGVLLRPAVAILTETYALERQAAFLLRISSGSTPTPRRVR